MSSASQSNSAADQLTWSEVEAVNELLLTDETPNVLIAALVFSHSSRRDSSKGGAT